MDNQVNSMKVAGMNLASWLGTIFSMQNALEVMQLICLLGSFTVSVFSVWWILQQKKNADRDRK